MSLRVEGAQHGGEEIGVLGDIALRECPLTSLECAECFGVLVLVYQGNDASGEIGESLEILHVIIEISWAKVEKTKEILLFIGLCACRFCIFVLNSRYDYGSTIWICRKDLGSADWSGLFCEQHSGSVHLQVAQGRLLMVVYGKLGYYAGRKAHLAWVGLLLSFCSGVVMVSGFWAVYRILDALLVLGSAEVAWEWTLWAMGLFGAGALCYFVSGYLTHVLAFALETGLRRKGIEGITHASFRFFDMHNSGTVRKVIDDNASRTHLAVAHLIPDLGRGIALPLGALALGFLMDWHIGVIVLALTVIAFIAFMLMMGGHEFMDRYQRALDRLSGETVEYVRGMQVVKIFGADVKSFRAMHQAIEEYSSMALEYCNVAAGKFVFYQWVFLFGVGFLVVPAVLFPGIMGSPEQLVIALIMVLFLLGALFSAINSIMWMSKYMYDAQHAMSTLDELYEEMGREVLLYGSETRMDAHDIEFCKVSFAYKDTRVLEGFDLSLEAGRTYALVGPSGSGKSTIAKLLSGFYRLDEGEIRIGGRPLTDYTKQTVAGNIAFVFQDSKLFKRSIYENVALAKPTASREQVLEAMRLAGCDSIIDKFPDGEHTLLGTEGVYLSGGEKQRVAIARAILKDAKIVVMDEASAAIDPDNEYALQRAFANLMKGRTVVMIAHRLSSIRNVDEVIYLENGRVVERGTHEALMSSASRYHHLQDMFNRANEWRVA